MTFLVTNSGNLTDGGTQELDGADWAKPLRLQSSEGI